MQDALHANLKRKVNGVEANSFFCKTFALREVAEDCQ